MKKILRLKGCICYDDAEVTVEKIIAALQKHGKMYAITIVSEISLKDCPDSWKPNQKTLNHVLRE